MTKSKAAGHKTAKDKEWFASSDEDYILLSNKIAIAKAAKKWLENKSSYFSMYHYRCRNFIKNDFSAEISSGQGIYGYNMDVDDESTNDTKNINWTT